MHSFLVSHIDVMKYQMPLPNLLVNNPTAVPVSRIV